MTDGDVFTGTLADGSAFIFANDTFDTLIGVTLTSANLPALDLTPMEVDSPSGGPSGLRAGQTLTLLDGGTLDDNFAVVDATVNVEGGSLGDDAKVVGGEVNISGGTLGFGFDANSGSEVNISGGSFDRGFGANSGSDVELIGGEFQLNGVAFTDSVISLASDDVFTGTLADGSAFIFANDTFDTLIGVTLTSANLPALDLTPMEVDSPSGGPSGLRAGQTLTLLDGGTLDDNFAVVDATVNVEGGSLGEYAKVVGGEVNISGGNVGNSFEAFLGSEVNISGGTVGDEFEAFLGSVVNISGGTVGDLFNANSGSEVNISGGIVGRVFDANSGSVVNISGGTVGGSFNANSGSEVNISGGNVGFNFFARSGSEVNISGGTVGDGFLALSGSEVNLFGTEFFLDGVPLDELVVGEAFTITDRDVTLTGLLADGSAFSFDLNSPFIQGEDYFDIGATLTVTLAVPEPSTAAGLIAALTLLLGKPHRR